MSRPAVVGTTVSFSVEVKDLFGNSLDDLSIPFNLLRATVQKTNRGEKSSSSRQIPLHLENKAGALARIQGTFVLTERGVYKLTVRLNELHVTNSPFSLRAGAKSVLWNHC